jgi:hypothetical protein
MRLLFANRKVISSNVTFKYSRLAETYHVKMLRSCATDSSSIFQSSSVWTYSKKIQINLFDCCRRWYRIRREEEICSLSQTYSVVHQMNSSVQLSLPFLFFSFLHDILKTKKRHCCLCFCSPNIYN